ncbi:MAG: 6-carboxytetrahydropterin synthase [Candidatus Lokiarchaeota archaeon]|nr:6-carboxytetrahydropterin synthase [Candidatus Lokiarchaeota archaeon]
MSYKIIVDGNMHKFSSAHFVIGHDKCGRIHGHNFHVGVEVSGPLDGRHFVLDFMDVKKAIKAEVDMLDHRILLPTGAKDLVLKEINGSLEFTQSGKKYVLPKEDACLLPLPAITSELLAKHFHDALSRKFKGYKIKVRIGETSSSFAEYGE